MSVGSTAWPPLQRPDDATDEAVVKSNRKTSHWILLIALANRPFDLSMRAGRLHHRIEHWNSGRSEFGILAGAFFRAGLAHLAIQHGTMGSLAANLRRRPGHPDIMRLHDGEAPLIDFHSGLACFLMACGRVTDEGFGSWQKLIAFQVGFFAATRRMSSWSGCNIRSMLEACNPRPHPKRSEGRVAQRLWC